MFIFEGSDHAHKIILCDSKADTLMTQHYLVDNLTLAAKTQHFFNYTSILFDQNVSFIVKVESMESLFTSANVLYTFFNYYTTDLRVNNFFPNFEFSINGK